MAANLDPVRIEGIQELNRALRAVGKDAQKDLRTAFKSVAEIVAADARSRVPKRTGKAARSIKAKGTNKGGAISFGGRAAEYYPFLDFGNKVDAGGGVGHKDSNPRPFIPGGRYVYPAIAANHDTIADKVDEVIRDVIRKHGLEGGVS